MRACLGLVAGAFARRDDAIRQRLADDVYAELVDIMFSAVTRLVAMAVLVTGIGAMMFTMTDDLVGAR